ncbi:MAG: TonB-dependent receptor [Gammaproteobacteria bacterium]
MEFTKRLGRRAIAAAAIIGAGSGIPAPGQAQELTEIIVTGRRQGDENLKEVPLAITAFDSATIASAGITNLQDVANLTPGLSFFNAFGENLPVPVIRGIVPQDIFGETAVAVFVDGVYVSGREGLNFSQLDVERIEVLKGPQSSTYGRNAFSGAINYVTKAPTDEFSAKSEVEIGNRGKQKVVAMASGPLLGESLTGRVSALYDEWDGSYDNTLAPENDIGGYRYRSLQGKLRWRPADSLDINLSVYTSNDEIDEAAVGGVPANCEDRIEQTSANANERPFVRLQNWCGRIPDLAELPDNLDASQYPNMVLLPNSVTGDSLPKIPEATGEDRDLLRSNLNVVWDAGFGTFSFLTGYSDTEQSSKSDFGRSAGNSIPLIYCNDFTFAGVAQCQSPEDWGRTPMGFLNLEIGTTTEEWSQEIRFTSPRDERLRYSTGLYYYHVDEKSYPGGPIGTVPLPASIFDIGFGPVAYPTSLAIGSYIFGGTLTPDGALDPLNRPVEDKTTEAWSVFGSVEFDITEKLTGNAEIRIAEERQEANTYTYLNCQGFDPDSGDPTDTSTFPFNFPDVAACGDDRFDLRATAPLYNSDLVTYDRESANASERFETVSGRAGLKYAFDSGWMLYGSIARGEKPGGLLFVDADFLTGSPESAFIPNFFEPEKLTAYEVGLKGYTADRRLGIDVAAFYNDWQDVVLRQLLENSPVDGRAFDQPEGFNANVGDAEVWGWEMTADMAFTDNLTGRLTVGYTDSTLTNARQDTYSLFPSFYTDDPTCAPTAIQAITGGDSDETELLQKNKATQCRQISGDVSGNTQLRQPKWTSSASLSYRRQLRGDWDWFSRVDANYLGKIFVGNDNQNYLPSRTNVNLRLGAESGRYSVELWARNLLANNNPIAAFRDIYWTNDADIQGQENLASIREISNFDDFPPFRISISYPSLRTYGLTAKVRFGGEQN